MASEKEVATVGGPGESGRPLTAIVGESEESRADSEPEGAVAGGGNTTDSTSAAADEVGARGHHGWRTGAREKVAGRREKPSGESSGVGGGGEGHEVYRVASDPVDVVDLFSIKICSRLSYTHL